MDKSWWRGLALAGALCVMVFLGACGQDRDSDLGVASALDVPKVNSTACMECHADVFKSWSTSDHALANRLVNPERDGEAFASERSAQFDLSDVEAVIGEAPLRQFLIKGDRGRLQAHSEAWDPAGKEWFSVFGDEERIAGEWGHWTGQGMNWNSNCAACHMTGYEKNYDPILDQYDSKWTAHGITCISCHENMDMHVAAARDGDYVVRESASTALTMQNCASCHSRRTELSAGGFRKGELFDDHYRLVLPDQAGAYFETGQSREENYVYGSFMLSRMGLKGVSCLDCHDPHSNELLAPVENNELCMKCHETGVRDALVIDPVGHSNHAAGSIGNRCVECHMPERTYMGRDERRDHGFTTPDPYLTIQYGTPNACSECHSEESDEWVAERFTEWYGESELMVALRDRGKLLHATNSGLSISTDRLVKRMDAEENPYWRATWLRLVLGPDLEGETLQAVVDASNSDIPIERAAALEALAGTSGWEERYADAMEDSSQIVRIQSMDFIRGFREISKAQYEEWLEFASMNSDRPSGALRLAEDAASKGDVETVLALVGNSVSFDRSNAELRYDVAILLDRIGRVEDGIIHLRYARHLQPEEARFAYALGQLLGEMGNWSAASRAFGEAVGMESQRDRWWFNLAIAQVRSGERAAAMVSLEQALELAPGNADYERFLESLR